MESLVQLLGLLGIAMIFGWLWRDDDTKSKVPARLEERLGPGERARTSVGAFDRSIDSTPWPSAARPDSLGAAPSLANAPQSNRHRPTSVNV